MITKGTKKAASHLVRSQPSLELLGLLESFDEEFASLLSIELQEVGVEVGSVRGQGLVAPLTHALIIYIANEPFV